MTGRIPGFILHPALRQLYAYWRSLSIEGGIPLRNAIDATVMPQLLPSLNLLDRGPTPDDLRYRLAGSNIVAAFGFEPRGLTRGEIRARHVAPQKWADFDVTSRQTHDVAARCLVSYTHDHMTSYQREFLAYARLMLPVSEDGVRASGVLGAIMVKRGEDAFWRDFKELHLEVPVGELGLARPDAPAP